MKRFLANLTAKSSKFLIEKLKIGSGSAFPGRVALAIDPKFIASYNKSFNSGRFNFFITGTNGKTTSSGILANIIKVATNKSPINNAFGANLYYGVASELVNSTNLNGELNSNDFVFEVDEAANRIREEVDPDANIIFGSAFSDDLDNKIRVSVVATGITGHHVEPCAVTSRSNNYALKLGLPVNHIIGKSIVSS